MPYWNIHEATVYHNFIIFHCIATIFYFIAFTIHIHSHLHESMFTHLVMIVNKFSGES